MAFAVLGCGSGTPTDMWITKDPDAGADFDAPVRETIVRADGGTDADASDDSAPDASDDADDASDDAAPDSADTDAATTN